MAKFNTKRPAPKPTTPVKTVAQAPDTRTYQGAVGWSRDPKSELFLLGVTNMVSEGTFYEDGVKRDQRFEDLVTQVAVTDPAWLEGFLPWLRNEANMRSAPVVAAAIAAKSMLANQLPGSRQIIAKSLGRADEPGEFLSYWISRWGDKLPMPVKRGVADAVVRLYSQRSLLKYDTTAKGLRFSNVIQLVHPEPKDGVQRNLFKYAMDRAYGKATELPRFLHTVARENEFRQTILEPGFDWAVFLAQPNVSETLSLAGLTWEDVIPRVPAKLKGRAWEALIPSMGYMALLRNLRNFDEARISPLVQARVSLRLSNPDEVAKSKQFPFRFLSAYRSLRSLTWGPALEAALDMSLGNVPELPGRTLVLVDRSGSMFHSLSGKSEVVNAELAAIFGTAVAMRNLGRVDLVQFGNTANRVHVGAGDSLLRVANERFSNLGGTYLAQAARQFYTGQDRVIVVTDEQYHDGSAGSVVPANVPVYTFNLVGYKPAGSVSGSDLRYTFGGLTDAAFKLIPLIEAGMSQKWPWEAE